MIPQKIGSSMQDRRPHGRGHLPPCVAALDGGPLADRASWDDRRRLLAGEREHESPVRARADARPRPPTTATTSSRSTRRRSPWRFRSSSRRPRRRAPSEGAEPVPACAVSPGERPHGGDPLHALEPRSGRTTPSSSSSIRGTSSSVGRRASPIVDDDDTEPNLSGYDNYFVVPAMSRIEGDLTTDDTYNLEANLATVENVLWMNPPRT